MPDYRAIEKEVAAHSEIIDKLVDKLNGLMAELIPEINQGKRPDVDKRAREAGVDPDTVKELVDHLLHKLGKDQLFKPLPQDSFLPRFEETVKMIRVKVKGMK